MTDPLIVYLDVDDEITSAAARIRATDARQIVLVLPTGSRLAKSFSSMSAKTTLTR